MVESQAAEPIGFPSPSCTVSVLGIEQPSFTPHNHERHSCGQEPNYGTIDPVPQREGIYASVGENFGRSP